MWGELRREIRRPWKLATFAAGLALLIIGSFYYQAPDWDIPVSIIMATFTYLTAGWSMRVILFRQWRHWPLMLSCVHMTAWSGVEVKDANRSRCWYD